MKEEFKGLHNLIINYLVVLSYILDNLLDRFRLGYLIKLLIRLLFNKLPTSLLIMLGYRGNQSLV
jgi:hypothetical protein